MLAMKKTVMKNYAHLLAVKGANVQKGQEVLIYAELDCPEFIALLCDECYKAGAKKVTVEWDYQPLTKIHVRSQSVKTLGTVKEWQKAKLQDRLENLPACIYVLSEDPDGLKGINQKKYAAGLKERLKITKPYRDAMDNKYQWCIAAVPGEKWAKKVFPDLRKSKAVEKLWEVILSCSRANGDAVKNWTEHNTEIRSHCEKLNSLGLKSLHYTAGNGTDLKIGLRKEGVFSGGEEKTLSGVTYNPNIPSEECFVSPKKGEADGIVFATKPLSYNGELIKDFYIRFENGKAVEWDAKEGKALLTELIGMDEGAAYLGECALVPFDSPINETGVLFYNTLFDENACCHLALGRGFPETTKDFEKYTLEELNATGINDSSVHEDFMIGTRDLKIIGETFDGKKVTVFENGTWAKF